MAQIRLNTKLTSLSFLLLTQPRPIDFFHKNDDVKKKNFFNFIIFRFPKRLKKKKSQECCFEAHRRKKALGKEQQDTKMRSVPLLQLSADRCELDRLKATKC